MPLSWWKGYTHGEIKSIMSFSSFVLNFYWCYRTPRVPKRIFGHLNRDYVSSWSWDMEKFICVPPSWKSKMAAFSLGGKHGAFFVGDQNPPRTHHAKSQLHYMSSTFFRAFDRSFYYVIYMRGNSVLANHNWPFVTCLYVFIVGIGSPIPKKHMVCH